MRARSAMMGVAVMLGGLLIGGASAGAAGGSSMPAGGAVRVILQPSANGGKEKILITGAIGDYGTSLDIDKDGKPDPSGHYSKVTLTRGTFEVNSTALGAALNKASPVVNDQATCSAEISATGPVTVFDGTGLYKGISGTVNATETFGFIGSRYTSGTKKGQCNESNNAPTVAELGTVVGTGTVAFS
jgi:hypothetical protein